MPTVEKDFTPEHDIDSTEHEDEVDRVNKEEQQRATQNVTAKMVDIISNQVQLITDLQTQVGKLNVQVAQAAMKPKVSEHPGVVTRDPKTGASDLKTKEAKVAKVIGDAQGVDKKNGNGEAHESKASKYLAAFAGLLTVGGPLLLQAFQIFRSAMAGDDISGALANAGDEALILAMVNQWKNESDDKFWDDLANFYLTHTAAIKLKNGVVGAQPAPTSADLVMMLHYASVLNPVDPTANFNWASAKEQSDVVDALKLTYSTSAKDTFIRALAGIKVNKKSVPRGIQAQLGELAVAVTI